MHDDQSAAAGRQPWAVPPRESTESTLPEGAGAAVPAAPPSGPVPAVHPGYAQPPGPPQGWPAPAPPAGRWEQPPAPAGGRRGSTGLGILIGVLVAALVLGAGAVAWFGFLQPDDDPSTSTSAGGDAGGKGGTSGGTRGGTTGGGVGGSPTAPSTRPSTPPSTQPSPPPADPEADAVAELNALRDEGYASVSLDGRWVAQLASKSVGIQDPLQVARNGSHVFYGADILYEHQELRRTVGGSADVFLLRSTDFGRTSTDGFGQPYWVTLADGGFGSADAVRAFCARTFPTYTAEELANACVPRTLDPSHP